MTEKMIEMGEFLYSEGITADFHNYCEETMLKLAISSSNFGLAKWLLEKGISSLDEKKHPEKATKFDDMISIFEKITVQQSQSSNLEYLFKQMKQIYTPKQIKEAYCILDKEPNLMRDIFREVSRSDKHDLHKAQKKALFSLLVDFSKKGNSAFSGEETKKDNSKEESGDSSDDGSENSEEKNIDGQYEPVIDRFGLYKPFEYPSKEYMMKKVEVDGEEKRHKNVLHMMLNE